MIKQISNMTDYEQTMNEVIDDMKVIKLNDYKEAKEKVLDKLEEEDHSTH